MLKGKMGEWDDLESQPKWSLGAGSLGIGVPSLQSDP